MQTYDAFFRALFVFVIIELESRRVVHFAVTRSPTDAWVAEQLRSATPFGEGPRYLIRDSDPKYGPSLARVAQCIEVLRTTYRAPKANAICERFLGSLRRECLDHILILGEGHLRHTLVHDVVLGHQDACGPDGLGRRVHRVLGLGGHLHAGERLGQGRVVGHEAIGAGEGVPMPVRFRVTMPDPPPNAQSIEYGHMWSRGPTETDVENIVDSWRRQRR